MWVDPECKERSDFASSPRWIAAGKTYEAPTSEGHAFRIRDVSGALLVEIPPTSVDTTTYLSVP